MNQLIDLVVTRVDLVDEGANSEAFIKIYKRKEGGKSMTLEEILAGLEKEQADVIRAAISAAADKAEKDNKEELTKANNRVKELEGELEKAKKGGDEDEDEILKNVDPKIRSIIEKARLQAKAAEVAVQKMAEKEAEAEAIAKAKEVSNVGVPSDDMVSLFKKLDKVDKEIAKSVHDVLKTASTQIATSKSFEEIGKSTEGTDGDAGSAWAKIEKKAQTLSKEKSITLEAAVGQVIEDNPELYDEYIKAN